MVARLVKNHVFVSWSELCDYGVRVAHVFAGTALGANQKMGSQSLTFRVITNELEVDVHRLKEVVFGLRRHISILAHSPNKTLG